MQKSGCEAGFDGAGRNLDVFSGFDQDQDNAFFQEVSNQDDCMPNRWSCSAAFQNATYRPRVGWLEDKISPFASHVMSVSFRLAFLLCIQFSEWWVVSGAALQTLRKKPTTHTHARRAHVQAFPRSSPNMLLYLAIMTTVAPPFFSHHITYQIPTYPCTIPPR